MKKILLTTTETLQGWEIESYLKPIFSNVVVGAGFLSDISAGFTDLFGGRSNSYERKLQTVNDSALQILQSKASELGANCILGLKINVHQISGKNVQMFMVSAYEIIKTSFPDLSNMSTKKGFLSSNEKEIWICKCSKANDMEDTFCTSCYNNKYGFKEDEIKPTTVINELNNKALALEELFKSV